MVVFREMLMRQLRLLQKEDLNTIPMLSVTITAMKKDMNVGMAITSVGTEIATSDNRENFRIIAD